jgi:Protein of unknown function (DUF4242)
MPTYVVERYVPRSTANDLRSEGARVTQAAKGLSGTEKRSVAYLSSIYMPDDEVSFCLFSSDSADSIEAGFEKAQIAFDRILEAEVLEP